VSQSKDTPMNLLHDLAYVFGGAFLANALPHLTAALMGRPLQSPFAKPPGEGLSSSTVNGVWGFANLVFAWLLLAKVGQFDVRAWDQAGAGLLGVLGITLMLANRFGRFNGGNLT
jgi:hypothetical protein